MAAESIDNEFEEVKRRSEESMRIATQNKKQLEEAIRRSMQDQQTKTRSVSEQEEEKKEEKSQDNDEIVRKLRKLKNKKKMGLIIGRSDSEPFTEPTINKHGWIWVSLDKQKRDKKIPDRFHLANVDINNWQWQLKLGSGKRGIGFDKVIVDWATLRYIKSPWKTLYNLLEKKNTSQLITELIISASVQPFGTHESININDNLYQFTRKMNENQKKDHIKKYETQTIEYLKTLFHTVEVKENQAYPTRQKIVEKFLIMTGPKKRFGGKKTKKVRKHQGINQSGGNKGRLKKGYRYFGKKLKSGLPQIIKIQKLKK